MYYLQLLSYDSKLSCCLSCPAGLLLSIKANLN